MFEDGIWRTIGGRRVFIRKGQDLKTAMKESGKFNRKKKKYVDRNDREAIDRIADNYENIDDYEGLTEIEIDYIKNRRREMSRQEFIDSANRIHEKTKQRALEAEKTTDEDKRYNTKYSDNEDYLAEEAFKKAEKIDDKLDRAIEMQLADDLGKGDIDDDDIMFKVKNYIRRNYNGDATDKEIFEKLKARYKNRGMYKENHYAGEELYSDDPNRYGEKYREINTRMYLRNNPEYQSALREYDSGERAIASTFNKDYPGNKGEKEIAIKTMNKAIQRLNNAYNDLYNEYKRMHPNSNISLNEFRRMMEKMR